MRRAASASQKGWGWRARARKDGPVDHSDLGGAANQVASAARLGRYGPSSPRPRGGGFGKTACR